METDTLALQRADTTAARRALNDALRMLGRLDFHDVYERDRKRQLIEADADGSGQALNRGQRRTDSPRRLFGVLAYRAIVRQLTPPSSDRCTPRSSPAHSSPAETPAASSGAIVDGGSGQPIFTRCHVPFFSRRYNRPSDTPATYAERGPV